jgi:hypothetical protein
VLHQPRSSLYSCLIPLHTSTGRSWTPNRMEGEIPCGVPTESQQAPKGRYNHCDGVMACLLVACWRFGRVSTYTLATCCYEHENEAGRCEQVRRMSNYMLGHSSRYKPSMLRGYRTESEETQPQCAQVTSSSLPTAFRFTHYGRVNDTGLNSQPSCLLFESIQRKTSFTYVGVTVVSDRIHQGRKITTQASTTCR